MVKLCRHGGFLLILYRVLDLIFLHIQSLHLLCSLSTRFLIDINWVVKILENSSPCFAIQFISRTPFLLWEALFLSCLGSKPINVRQVHFCNTTDKFKLERFFYVETSGLFRLNFLSLLPWRFVYDLLRPGLKNHLVREKKSLFVFKCQLLELVVVVFVFFLTPSPPPPDVTRG